LDLLALNATPLLYWLTGSRVEPNNYRSRRLRLLDEEGERCRVSVQKVPISNRPNLSVAEKAGKPERPQPLLDHLGIVVRFAKHVLTAAIAAAETTAENSVSAQLLSHARQ